MQILNPPSSLRLISTIYAASVSVGRLRLIIIVIQLAQKCRAVTIMLNACIWSTWKLRFLKKDYALPYFRLVLFTSKLYIYHILYSKDQWTETMPSSSGMCGRCWNVQCVSRCRDKSPSLRVPRATLSAAAAEDTWRTSVLRVGGKCREATSITLQQPWSRRFLIRASLTIVRRRHLWPSFWSMRKFARWILEIIRMRR